MSDPKEELAQDARRRLVSMDWCDECNDYIRGFGPHVHCPKCSSPPGVAHEVRNFSQISRDGDVYCRECGTYVRDYDAG